MNLQYASTSMFQEKFCIHTLTLLVLAISGPVDLMWMVKTCIPWTIDQLLQLLIN